MVKKRGGRGPKQTKSQLRKRKKAQHFGGRSGLDVFHTQAVKDAWDKKKTMKQNYAAMGLDMNPNADINNEFNPKVGKKLADSDVKIAELHRQLDESNELSQIPTSYIPKSIFGDVKFTGNSQRCNGSSCDGFCVLPTKDSRRRDQ